MRDKSKAAGGRRQAESDEERPILPFGSSQHDAAAIKRRRQNAAVILKAEAEMERIAREWDDHRRYGVLTIKIPFDDGLAQYADVMPQLKLRHHPPAENPPPASFQERAA